MIGNIEGRKLKSIFEIANLITSAKDFFEIKDTILEKMISVIDPIRACINLFSIESDEYTYLICSKSISQIARDSLDGIPMKNGSYKVAFKNYPSYIQESVKDRKTIWIKNIYEDEQSRSEINMAKKYGYIGRVVIPIVMKNKTIGFMTCFINEDDKFDKEDIDYISSISFLIGLSIEITRKNHDRESVVRKLKRSITYINDATKELYQNRGIDNFLSTINSHLCRITNSESAIVLLKDDKSDTQRFNQHGKDINILKVFDQVKKSYEIDLKTGDYFNHKECEILDYGIKSYIYHALRRKEEVIGYIMAVNSKAYDDDDLKIFKIFSNQIVVAMEMYIHSKKIVEHKLLEKELELVSKQQRFIMSTEKIKIENQGELSFYHKPSRYIGGDFCRIEKIADDKYAVFLTDVMGHGIMSNYFSAMIKGSIKTLLVQDNSPAQILTYLNKVLYSDFDKSSVFATARVAIFDFEKNIITSANGGHHHPIGIKNIKDDIVIEILDIEEGFPVGILQNNEYEEHEYNLEEFELIAFYTDGIIEAQDSEGENYGEERLKNFLLKNYSLKSEEIYSKFRNEIKEFTGQDSLEDDYILLIFKKEQENKKIGDFQNVLLNYKL